MQATKERTLAALSMLQALAEAIRELKRVPSGHLYAQVMNTVDLPTYEGLIGILKESGVIREEAHELIWQR